MRVLDKYLTRMDECRSLAEQARTEELREQYLALGRMWERLAMSRTAEAEQAADLAIP